MMTKERMFDLMYMYGADTAQKMEQIVSLELFGTLEKSDEINDIELSFYDAVRGTNQYTISLENGTHSVISNHALLFKLDSHVTNILGTIDAVIALEEKGVKIDYKSVISPVNDKTSKLLEEAITFIKEW